MAGRNKKNSGKQLDNVFFWETARRFLDYELPVIRKKSRNTVIPTVHHLTSVLTFWRQKKESGVNAYVLMTWIRRT